MTAILPKSRKRYALIFAIGIGTVTGVASIAGCHKVPDATVAANDSGPDPANANMAPINSTQQQAAAPVYRTTAAHALPARQENESQQSAEEYPQTTPQAQAPAYPQQPQSSNPDDTYDQTYEDQIDAGQQALEANSPPPPLPTYQQPEAPGPNYIWTPGYWSYSPMGYYWVPGAWVMAPYPGALWTPGYWGYVGNRYRFNPGFWGTYIGFYGGINYGFGYTGSGYHGGYWRGNNFYYNRAVNRINETRITNVYNRTVVVNNTYNNTYNRVSYAGGPHGVPAHPQPAELAALRAPRTPPMSTQIEHQREAAQNHQQFYNQNKGRPAIVAAPQPISADHNVHPIVRPTSANLPHSNQTNSPQVQPPHPGQPQVQPVRPTQPQYRPGESQVRPVNPTPPRATPTQPEVRNAPQPQPTRPQPEIRPSPQPQPQVKPAPQPQPRPIPESQTRPVPQAQPRPVPETQPRPVPQAQPRPVPEAQPRPVPQAQPRPQPQQMQRSQPAERPAPHSEFHSQPEQRPAP
jgi:hypothetical protein